MHRRKLLFLFCSCMALLLLAAGCGSPEPAPAPAPAVDEVATRVAVERAVAATLTAESAAVVPPTATPTLPAAAPTQAPTAAATPTAAAPPTPTTAPPTATRISRVIREVNGSDNENENLRGPLEIKQGRYVLVPGFEEGQLPDPLIFRDRLNLQVEVSDTDLGPNDGDGIALVVFEISDSTGVVYTREVENPAFCLFAGDGPDCPALILADANFTWPETGLPIQNDFHNVTITIVAASGAQSSWFFSFEIEAEGAQPQVGILRPACGDTVRLAAGRPIELRYGIWANRGLVRAAANAPYVQIELTIDGQPVAGQQQLPPQADLAGAICGRDYEDSYWVYHLATLDSLAPGSHTVQVTYRFTAPVEDGYGAVYNAPFSQEYILIVAN